MDLIVTHNNADFDAFSSLVAAKKLYPRSKLLLPGSQEMAVRQFLSLVRDKVRIENERTCDLDNVKRLVVVDTRHRSRIGAAARLVDDSSVEKHVYDHHPRTRYDIKGKKDVFREVGATVSILVDILRRKKSVKITPLEATIMLLGIYEETGSLTYRTTTRLDVDTVSFLLSKGANLQAVSFYLNRNLTEEELTFLTSLIASTKVVSVNGINVAVAEAVLTRFIGELGTIVRKLEEVENFPVLFALFQTKKDIRIIARSRLKEVDVNRTLKHFGGGGHRSAASAKIKNAALKHVKSKLLAILGTTIKTRIFAGDIMTYPVKTIPSDRTISETKKILGKLRLKGAPVMDGKRLIGVITQRDIGKALKYRYGHASVKGYMNRFVITVRPDTPLYAIQKLMFTKKIGRVPVLKNKKLVGIVTRTDILKTVHKDIFKKQSLPGRRRARLDISAKMEKILPKQILSMLRTIGAVADREGFMAYVVGGFVRDVLLKEKNFDIDIVAEGEAIAFGRKIADIFGGSFVAYKKFGTSTVIMNWPKGIRKPSGTGPRFKIDFATARKESYEKPAALPTVLFSSLKDDLQRRDFTINAMAANLNKESFGRLIDFFGGEKDLENGIVRVLHDVSFIDDPTRIFRAVRFEQRFGFRIDRYTETLIKNAVKEGMFSRTQHHRIRDELILILQEEHPIKALSRMKELHELRFIHRKIHVDKTTRAAFIGIKKGFLWYNKNAPQKRHVDLWLIYLMALLKNLNPSETKAMCDKFAFRRCDRIRLLSCRKNRCNATRRISATRARPSDIYRALEPLSFEEILFIRAFTRGRLAQSRIKQFFDRHNRVKTDIGGEDIKMLGVTPGPLYTRLLTKVLDKKINGEIKTKKEELDFVKTLVGKMKH